MPVDRKMYEQYLKLRYEYRYPTSAADVVRRIKHDIRCTVKRRLSTTHKLLEQMVSIQERNYSKDMQDYQVAGIAFRFGIYSYSPEDPFESWGMVEWRREAKYREGHDRNGEYYVLGFDRGSRLVLTPSYTLMDHYRDGIGRWGKALAWQAACAARDAAIKIYGYIAKYGEAEYEARLEFVGDDDLDFEYFSSDCDLTSILDWLRDKIDSRLAEQQRHAA